MFPTFQDLYWHEKLQALGWKRLLSFVPRWSACCFCSFTCNEVWESSADGIFLCFPLCVCFPFFQFSNAISFLQRYIISSRSALSLRSMKRNIRNMQTEKIVKYFYHSLMYNNFFTYFIQIVYNNNNNNNNEENIIQYFRGILRLIVKQICDFVAICRNMAAKECRNDG